jgi:hypothetical protein
MLQNNHAFLFCESDCHDGPAFFSGLWFSHCPVLTHPNINLYVFPSYLVFISCCSFALLQFTTMDVVATLFILHSSPRASASIFPCGSLSLIVREIFHSIGPFVNMVSVSLIACGGFSPLTRYSQAHFPMVFNPITLSPGIEQYPCDFFLMFKSEFPPNFNRPFFYSNPPCFLLKIQVFFCDLL